MKIFEDYLDVILRHEGGYSNDIVDKGGETYRGVSRKYYPNWKGWKIVDEYKKLPKFPNNLESNSELQALVVEFYHSEQWVPMNLNSITNENLKLHLFDMGVNCGRIRAIRLLQAILDFTFCDGIIGPKTLEAINKYPNNIVEDYKLARKQYYNNIVKADPSQAKFIDGWLSRVDHCNFL